MDDSTYLLEAQTTLPDGQIARGPITTADHETYVFVNTVGTLSFTLEMKRGDLGWYQTGGTKIQGIEQMVDQLGVYVDDFLGKSPITNKIGLE